VRSRPSFRRFNRPSTFLVLLCAGFSALSPAWTAEARITRIVISTTQSPTFGGTSFGAVGAYEKLRGTISGEVDPLDPKNTLIADVSLAPRNERGMVEYTAGVLILRPVDPSKGNRRVLYEINNRGTMYSLGMMNDAVTGGSDPTAAADAGNGFLMQQGYTLVLSGWDVTAPAGAGRLTMTAPVATAPDGSPIVGLSLEEFVIDNATTATGVLTYPAADQDKSHANLTVRSHYSDTPVPVPQSGWEYVSSTSIRLLPAGSFFANGSLYEFVYPARNPIVAGLGLAGIRDLAAFFRFAVTDDSGAPNPLAGRVEKVYSFCFSQPCRLMRDFVRLGFNQDERGHQAFDGVLNWVGGASSGSFNHRFAQPFRTHRQHIGRWYPEAFFPFANNVLQDPVTGRIDGVLRRCEASQTCPRIFEVNSANEYWAKTGSLLHTDPLGTVDLPPHPAVRMYFLSGLPHNAGVPSPTTPGVCAQPRNPLVANRSLRALLVQLDGWVSGGVEPPPSLIPRKDQGTLVPALPQSGMGFPNIPGVTYTGLTHTGDLLDFGPNFDTGGIWSLVPPILRGTPYAILVPKTDADGNDEAGLRMVEVAVPTATYTGWNTRAGPASPDGCDASGTMISFARTRAERIAAGDPRLSIEERYPTHAQYVDAVQKASGSLRGRGFLLDEDVARYVAEAGQSSIGLSTWLLPSSARTSGAGAPFTTDVTVANTGPSEAAFTLKFLGHGVDGRTGPEKTFTLAAGRSATYADVLGSLFGVTTDYGALRLSSSSPALSLVSQTWTPLPSGGSVGQSVPAFSDSEVIRTGASRSITAIREDGSFRTDLYLANATESPIDVDVSLVADSGATLGAQRVSMPPLGMTQVTRVVRVLGVSADTAGARLVLSTQTPGGAFAAYAATIDNATNDPRTLLPRP
jgi:hypothetical protein